MKNLNLFFVALALMCTFASANNLYANDNVVFYGNEVVASDGVDPDLFLDCFESAVKSGDMELAAKIASELYRMNLSDAQKGRFSSIEDRISRKDYQAYRENLKNADAKSSTVYDDEIVTYGEDEGLGNVGSFMGDIFDVFSGVGEMIDSIGRSGRYTYEHHDSIDGGFFDLFFDVFSNDGNVEDSIEEKNAPDKKGIDAALDEYERFVNRAVESLRRVINGERNAIEEYKRESEKASEIAEDLEKSTADMTKAQFKRFIKLIERMFIELF